MTTVTEHYANHLAPIYLWMAGGPEAALQAGTAEPPIFVKANPSSRLAFAGFDPLWGAQDLQARKFHPPPSAQFVFYLQGVMSITTTDGETRRFGSGDVLRVEDTAPAKGT
jgi:hypothetical protein